MTKVVDRRQFVQLLVGGSTCLLSRSLFAQDASGWVDTHKSGPFYCVSEFPLEPLADVFSELHDIQNELIRTLAVRPAAGPIEIYLLSSAKQQERFLSAYLPKVPFRRALYVKSSGRARVFAYRHPELTTDLRHESTHALLHDSLPFVPLWLDEGLAEYFEVPPEKRPYDHPHLKSLRWNLRFGLMPSLESLEARESIAEMGASEYRFAWAWAHFMLHGPRPAHQALVNYLRDISRDVVPGPLSRRLAEVLPDPQRQFVHHFRHWQRPRE